MDPFSLLFAAAVVLGGAFVRGYSGFGSGMIWVSGLSLVFPPVVVVPAIYLLDLAASAHLVPKAWKDVEWRSLGWLLAGAGVALPAGLYLLAALPASPVRVAIALVVLAATALLWRGFAWKAVPGPLPALVTGLFSGFIGGGTGIGGPPVILFYFSSPAGVSASRASVIAFLFGLDLVAIGMAMLKGLYTREVGLLVVLLLLPVLAGTVLGHRRFLRTDPERFRRFVLLLLAALSAGVFLRAVLG